MRFPALPSPFPRQRAGSISAPLKFWHPGTYWLSVQVIDAEGRRSNVLDRSVNVFAQSSPPGACAAVR